MSGTTAHTDKDYIEMPIRLPKEMWDNIAPLAHAAGLTVEQMSQAIFTLQANAGGWFAKEKEDKKEQP
jgi:hypothetical protein